MNSRALKRAQEAVRQAQQMERAADPSTDVDDYWDRAERLYREAGVDPEWFDHGSLTDTLDDTPASMSTVWIFPTDRIEFTYEPDPHVVTGVVVSIEDVVRVGP